MADQRVQIRMTTALSAFEDHARSDHFVETKRQGPTDVYVPRPEDLVPIPPGKYHGLFPHACPVLYTNTMEDPLVVSSGEVEDVWIDVSPEGSRDFFYTVTCHQEPSVTAAECQLQWAPGCQVLVKLPSVSGQKWIRAVVRGSYQGKADADPLYSVQLVEPSTGLFHGLSKDCISYRFRSSDPPPAHSETADAHSCSSEGLSPSPTKEVTDEGRPHSPEPPSFVDASPASDEASKECVQPVLPTEVPAMANEVIDSSISDSLISQHNRFSLLNQPLTESSSTGAPSIWRSVTDMDEAVRSCVQPSPTPVPLTADYTVSRVESDAWTSPHKRSLPVDQPITESSFADDPFMGRAIAELKIPSWMGAPGLNDSFVELICFADKNFNECRFRVLESSPKNRSDPNISLSPKQTIFLYGRDLDDVGKACDLVSDLLYRYVEVEDKQKLQRSLQHDGWRKSLIGNDETGNTNPSSTYKKAKVTPKAERETISDTALSSIPQVLLQNSTSDISEETRVRNETHPPPPTGSSSCKEEVLSEYSYEERENSRFDRDDTIRILIPRFADSVAIQDTLIGEKRRNRKSLERDTRCEIRVIGLDADNRGRNRRQIEVEVTGHDLQRAREIVEDEILRTIPREDKGKMLYYLAKDNHYGGSSDGIARYQRSPADLHRRVWMAVVDVPSDFQKYSGLFICKGIPQIKTDTKCRFIRVVNSQPIYIFLSDSKVEAVNEAADAVQKRLGQMATLSRHSRSVE